jgi:hypothetical protein
VRQSLLAALVAAPLVLGTVVGTVVGAAVGPAAAEEAGDRPLSPAETNRSLGLAYFDAVPASDSVLLVFTSTRDGVRSCFEYRSEDSAPLAGESHPDPSVTDGVYASVCVTNETKQATVEAGEYVEVRLTLGDDPVEYFDWQRVQTTGTPDQPTAEPHRPDAAANCKKGGWRSFGYKNQGRCVSDVRKQANQQRKVAKREWKLAKHAAKGSGKKRH